MIKLPGYTEAEKRVIATGHLLTLALASAHHGLTAEQVHIPDEAIEAVIIGYTRKAGIWDLAGALAALCGKVVRRRAEGDETPGRGHAGDRRRHARRGGRRPHRAATGRHRPVPYHGG